MASTEFVPISDDCRSELMTLLDSVSRNVVKDVREKQIIKKFWLSCWNLVPCLNEVETRHAEADMALRQRHQWPNLTLKSTHKDICDLHLHHTVLIGISPTSLKQWTPRLWLLNKNAMNNLFGEPLAPSVAWPYVVDGTYGFAEILCWYVVIINVALVSDPGWF